MRNYWFIQNLKVPEQEWFLELECQLQLQAVLSLWACANPSVAELKE